MNTENQPTLQTSLSLIAPSLPQKVSASSTGLHIERDLSFDEWSALAPSLGNSMRSLAFVIGDWLVYGENMFQKQLLLPGMEDEGGNDPSRIPENRYKAAHDAILRAIETVLQPGSGAPRTPDLGGQARTQDLGRAIAEAL
jgi:hypothetical protein